MSNDPIGAFWSVTMYNDQGFLVANPINRYNVGNLTPGLITRPDGSVVIQIQPTQPADTTV